MGFYDRDYMRDPRRGGRGGFGFSFGPQSITTWIIIINIAVFIIDHILARMGIGYVMLVSANGQIFQLPFTPLQYWGHFSELTAISHLQIWRFITFQFLHYDLNHIVFNMIALFFFGPLVESYLGSRRFLPFYLLCGIGGALFYLLLLVLHFQIGDPWVPLIGASAGIFGVLIAGALIAPNATILLFFVFPMQLRTLAWLFIGYAVYQIVTAGQNAGGEAAHLGGAALGYLLIQNPRLLDFVTLPQRRRLRYR